MVEPPLEVVNEKSPGGAGVERGAFSRFTK